MAMALGHRVKEARMKKGLTQEQLALAIGKSQSVISSMEKRDSKKTDHAKELAKILDVSVEWLLTGQESASTPESNAVILPDKIVDWDSNTPLEEDEIELPYFTEVQLAAGNGSMEINEINGPKLRFSRSTLKRHGVHLDKAVCVGVTGNSMEPILPDGCTVGIDVSQNEVRDGKMYAVRVGEMVRVKLCYRIPTGGVRLRSYNRDEHPDEEYQDEQMADVKIIGRVFWSSVLW